MTISFFFVFRNKHYKFIIVDFEFTVLENNKHDLICGSISNSLDRFKVVKLEGWPLLVTDKDVWHITERDQNWAFKNIINIFGWPSAKAEICLAQIYDSNNSTINNLHKQTILDYIKRGKQMTAIVLWNGDTDMKLLNRLGLDYPILNIRAYDCNNDRQFTLQLQYNKHTITEIILGRVEEKNGRMLNLLESHDLVCHINHKITHAHDPWQTSLWLNVFLTSCYTK